MGKTMTSGGSRTSSPAGSSWKSAILQDGLIGLASGVFFSVIMFDFLFVGAIVWMPVLLWLEVRRSRKPAWLAGFLVRVGLCVAILLIADRAPMKYEDTHRVGPL